MRMLCKNEKKSKPSIPFLISSATLFATLAAVTLIISFCPMESVHAETLVGDNYYNNTYTGYAAVIIDGADYLSESEENELLDKMKELTDYTNVIYLTDENNTYALESYSEGIAEAAAYSLFDRDESVVVYVVDNEYDYIYAQGSAMRTITSSKAYNITDNVYMYSAREDYCNGAVEAFSECLTLFNGRKISNNMRFICNGFVALFISSLVCYIIISRKSRLKYTGGSELIKGAICYAEISNAEPFYTHTQKTYSPKSSSGGGHGGHSGGHSHSGGGHSH